MSAAPRTRQPLRKFAPTAVAAAAALTLAPAAASAATATVTGQQTAVTPSPALVTALSGNRVTVRAIGGATTDAQSRFVFPVTGGLLALPSLKGRVAHRGGLEFRNRVGIKFGIRSFVIDTTLGSPTLTALPTAVGQTVGLRLPVASIGGLTKTVDGETTVLTGTLKLNAVGALYLNTFFGKSAFKAGTPFGDVESRITVGTPVAPTTPAPTTPAPTTPAPTTPAAG